MDTGAPAGKIQKQVPGKKGTDYIIIKTEDIAYFHAAHKLVCLVDNKGQEFMLDQSLTDIESQLDPARFYRVTRKYLINSSAIERIKAWPKRNLLLEVGPAIGVEIIISQENAAVFKA